MEFGDILRQLRLERGLSQDELAALLGTTKQVISRYETKKRVPRLSVVSDFAEKLGVPLSALSGETPLMAAGDAPRRRAQARADSGQCRLRRADLQARRRHGVHLRRG